ncbi:hypothetical protein DPEC_G00265640 [Dallia pectoralis]|uniref:Uncharacterized protein n=1 Tax=Dallia pectoralis TaxID=75939 RepID=A0ACC2FN94_DALPE|nr:hypothetical protein DPEC_G00265640 [Dallia pectoralis]
MHTSLFGDLVFAIPENHDETTPFSELSSSEDRFRSMCDIGAEDDHLLRTARIQHDTFELLLDTRGKSNFKESLASYLYQCGVRGSVYCTFLSSSDLADYPCAGRRGRSRVYIRNPRRPGAEDRKGSRMD